MRGSVRLLACSVGVVQANRPSDDVGRSAAKTALAELERALCRDRSHVVFSASPGTEKTRVLRALVERLTGSLRVVRVCAAGLSEDEVCARILRGLGQQPGDDDEGRLLSIVQRFVSRNSALVLLIRDADAIPAAALRYLGRLAAASRPGLRLALTLSIDGRSKRNSISDLVTALGVGAQKVALDLPMERDENSGVAGALLDRSALVRRRPCVSVPDPLHDKPPTPPNGMIRAGRAQRPRSLARATRAAQLRAYAMRALRSPQRTTVALLIALALLGVHRLGVRAAPGEAVREPPRTAVESPLARSPGPVPDVEGEKEKGAPREHAQPAPTFEKSQPAVERPVRSILVSLNARPWARIEIDGRDVGITPLADLPLSPGLHRFRAHLPDGRVLERAVHVDEYRDHISFP